MRILELNLRRTDYSFVSDGMVSLSHLSKLCGQRNGLHGKTLNALRKRGIQWMKQVGSCDAESLTVSIKPTHLQIAQTSKERTELKPIWKNLRSVLNGFNLMRCVTGSKDLIINRETRKRIAENSIKALALRFPLKPSTIRDPNHTESWASDGSMRPATAGILDEKTITCAITGPKTMVFQVRGKARSILHGELMGMIASATVAEPPEPSGDKPNSRLYSDHLNTVRFIEDHKAGGNTDARLRYMPGRSYYRWLTDLLNRNPSLEIQYTKGHVQSRTSTAAKLNFEADHYASKASLTPTADKIPNAPTPTFYMDEYTFHSDELSWIESNIKQTVTLLMERKIANQLATGHRNRMATWLFDQIPPPSYPYNRAASAFSAAVQLYSRSGQLPTADNMFRKRMRVSNLCRFGCIAMEDVHHIFTVCPSFDKFRKEALEKVLEETEKMLVKEKVGDSAENDIKHRAKSLFKDCPRSWPLARSQYYLGHIPPLKTILKPAISDHIRCEKIAHSIHSIWHMSAIRLTSRIWGDLIRRIAPKTSKTI